MTLPTKQTWATLRSQAYANSFPMLLYVILCPLVQSKEEREAWLGSLQLRFASTLYIYSLLCTRIQHTHNLHRSLRLSPSPSHSLSSSTHLSLLTATTGRPFRGTTRYLTLCQHCQAKGYCRFSQNHANPSTCRTWDKESYPSRRLHLFIQHRDGF